MNQIPEVKFFPAEGFDIHEVDLLDLTKVYYSGLYQRQVSLADGTERTYKVYIPSTAAYGDDPTYLAVPDGVDTAEFLVKSGWIDIAEDEKNAIILCVFEPDNKKWGENEDEYMDKAFQDMYSPNGLRSFVYTSDFNWRWTGYGRGGELVMRYALKNPMLFAALAVNGTLKISNEELRESGEIYFVNSRGHAYTEWPNKKIPVPIWLMGEENEAVVDYWKQANECTNEKTELKDGYLFCQNPLSANIMTFDQKVGQVKVTPQAPSFYDQEANQKIFRFLHSFARCGMNSPYANMLYNAPDDSFFKRESMVVDGMEREWYVHLPVGYTGKEPLPVVFYFHGSGQSGLIAMRQGGWWQYGDKKNFITVCPSGSLRGRAPGQIPTIIWRCGTPSDGYRPWTINPDNELENRFVRAMLKVLKSEYNIDTNRMYITGQSNGCGMSQMMSEKGSDLFTAVASTGVASFAAQTPLPNFTYGGEFDRSLAAVTENNELVDEHIIIPITDALEKKGIAYKDAGIFKNGIHTNFVWTDKNGVPVFRFCAAKGCAHSWRQNICAMFWDEWFCRFSRDPETGNIVYMKKGR